MQGGKNRFLPKEMTANRFFWDSHWLEIWSNHFCPSMGPNGGIVAMDSEQRKEGVAAYLWLSSLLLVFVCSSLRLVNGQISRGRICTFVHPMGIKGLLCPNL